MRTLLHISDLHFGRLDAARLQPLRDTAIAVRPDLTVVSGDITQRARASQFREAARFLESLPGPRLVVPGNHDVPLYNVPARFLLPLWGYRRYIAKDPEPLYQDEELTVLGLNSSRSLTIQDGRLNHAQIARMRHAFPDGSDSLRILVSHHPFVLPEGSPKEIVTNAEAALSAMASARVDAALTGHLHTSFTDCRAVPVGEQHWGVVLAQAGTISLRSRGETGAFNVIRLDHARMSIDRYHWDTDGQVFAVSLAEQFSKGPHGWVRA